MSEKSNENQGQLIRTVGLSAATLLVVSSVIGSGIFKKVAPMSAELHSPTLVIIAWLLAGFITLAGALSNAEIASMLVDSGGEYVYFQKIYNRFFAFMFGWANFAVIRTASIASIAYVFSQSLNSLFTLPQLPQNYNELSIFGLQPLDNFGVKIVAIVMILFLTAFNIRGMKMGKNLSNILTTTLIIAVVLIIIFGLFSNVGSMATFNTHSILRPEELNGTMLISAISIAALSAFWAYEGWASVGFIGGEIKNPQKNLPLAITFGTLIVMVLYVLLNFVYLYILPIDEFIGIHINKNGVAAVAVMGKLFGQLGIVGISLLILMTTFNCISTTILLAGRLSYAMARDGIFFKSVNYIHPVYNTPSKALNLQSIWCCILVLSGTFDQLTDMLIFASFIFYGATTLGVFILRKKMPDAPRLYKVIGYPVVPALFLIFCIALILSTLYSKPTEAAIGLALMATGIPFYIYWSKKA